MPTGEEDEDEIYSQRSKLCATASYLLRVEDEQFSSAVAFFELVLILMGWRWARYRFKDGEWKERGLGESKLLRHRVGMLRVCLQSQYFSSGLVFHLLADTF